MFTIQLANLIEVSLFGPYLTYEGPRGHVYNTTRQFN
jgi:hypothetical protein